jgi:excinuclease ABC subunit C
MPGSNALATDSQRSSCCSKPSRMYKAGATSDHMNQNSFDYQSVLATLPNLPGVYRMFDTSGNVLCGQGHRSEKAGQFLFQKTDHSPRIS